MSTLSPENSLSAKRSATFILVCSLRFRSAAQADLELVILLPLSSEGWDYKLMPLYLTGMCSSSIPSASLLWFTLGLSLLNGKTGHRRWSKASLPSTPARGLTPTSLCTLLGDLRTQYGFLPSCATLNLLSSR